MEKLDFIKEIIGIEELIEQIDFGNNELLKDLVLILIKMGSIELLITVFENFQGLTLSFTQRPVSELKKIFVLQNQEKPVEKLAHIVNVSSRTIYAWRAEQK